MQNPTGLFIVLEGSDGSGKTTQFEALKKRLAEAGHEVEVFDFPRYDQPSSYFISKYLNGDYGPANSVSPYTASLFYALDRYEAAPQIRKALAAGKIVLSNRYVGSNMAHQGSKFNDDVEKRSFFIWEDSIEYQLLNIPRPTINLYLRVPAEVSYQLISQKKPRNYTANTHDQHEADLDHLKAAVETYDLLCQLFPRDFQAIDCALDGELLSIETVSLKLWDQLSPLLPDIEPQPMPPAEVSSPIASQEVVVDLHASPATTSSYTWTIPKLSYLAAIEIKTRLPELKISDRSWTGAGSDYAYYTPQSLSTESVSNFQSALRAMAKNHRALHQEVYNRLISKSKNGSLSSTEAVKKSTKILRDVTPLSACTSARLLIPKDLAPDVLKKLSFIQNEEVAELTRVLADELGRLWPEISSSASEITEQQSMPEAISSIIEKLTREMVPQKSNGGGQSLKLIDVQPRNEFDLIADELSRYSRLSRQDILAQIDRWNYQQKIDALSSTLSKSGDLLERATYRVDYSGSWPTYIQILKLNLMADIERQLASPVAGYDIPSFIEAEILEDDFNELFKQSQAIYKLMQTEHDGRTLEYALLMGHHLHWQISLSATDIKVALGNTELAPLAKRLVKLVESVHPTVAARLGQPT